MKRYVHASIDSSAPNWLRKELVGDKWSNSLRDQLLKKRRIALDKVQFLDHKPEGASLPIYLLETDYGTAVYAPGINDDSTAGFNGRHRKLGSLAKSSLMDRAVDVVWIDLDDPNNFYEKREKYQDPRRTYRYDAKQGDYAGQYKRRDYLGLNRDTGESEYGPEYWSSTGKVPSNETRARDKSGYKIPDPAQRIADYYSKFPERITDKVDAIYDRFQEVKQILMDADFSVLPEDRYGKDKFSDAYRTFSDAVRKYRDLLGMLDSNKQLKGKEWGWDYNLKEFSQLTRIINEYLDEVEDLLA